MASLIVPIENLEIPPSILAKRAALFDALLAMAMRGLSLGKALESVKIPVSNYYRWRRAHPEWIASLHAEAEVIAVEAVQQRALELTTQRIVRQQEIDELILEEARTAVEKIIAISRSGSSVNSLAAIKQLREIAREGFVASPEKPRQEDEEEVFSLPAAVYNPYAPIAKGNITLADGTQITIIGPEIVDAL